MDRLKKIQTYGALALSHAKLKGLGGKNQPPLPTIKPGDPGWDLWRRYFVEYLGFMPLQMKRVTAEQSKEMTVPAERPEDFDGSYSLRQTRA